MDMLKTDKNLVPCITVNRGDQSEEPARIPEENAKPLLSGEKTDQDDKGNPRNSSSVCHNYSESCRVRLSNCVSPCLAEGRKPQGHVTWSEKLKYAILCPPHGKVGHVLTVILLAGVSWTSAWCILGDSLLPGGNIFALLVLLILCHISGRSVKFIKLQPLLGECSSVLR